MRLIFPVEFSYHNKRFCGIVRMSARSDGTEYHVRIMNGRLDRWLYGHHVFKEVNGQLVCVAGDCPDKIEVLRMSVHAALVISLSDQVKAVDGSRIPTEAPAT